MMEKNQPLICAIPDGGHFLANLNNTYLPYVIELLRTRPERFKGIIDSISYPALPAPEVPVYEYKKEKQTVREKVKGNIRRNHPRLYPFIPL